MSAPDPSPARQVFRLSWLAYGAVGFVAVCTLPIALIDDQTKNNAPGLSWRILLLAVPLALAFFIARTRTVVDASGIEVRAMLGRRHFGWDAIRGLAVDRSVYAVLFDGRSIRLPCVRTPELHLVAEASGGRLPEVDAPTAKHPPTRQRRG